MTDDAEKSLRVELDTHECELSPSEIQKFEASLETLRKRTHKFPLAELRILVEFNGHSTEYSVKTTLVLPGTSLANHEHHVQAVAAFEQCLEGLLLALSAYEARLSRDGDQRHIQHHTKVEVEPSVDPDAEKLQKAVDDADYSAFREETFGYEESVRKRIGRLIERHEDLDAQVGRRFGLDQLTEGVFLRAFEGYNQRPIDIRFGDWLESYIEPTLAAVKADPDGELENIEMVRAAREAEEGEDAVR